MPLFEQDKRTPKQTMRIESMQRWAAKMRLLKDIHQEVEAARQAKVNAVEYCMHNNSFIG